MQSPVTTPAPQPPRPDHESGQVAARGLRFTERRAPNWPGYGVVAALAVTLVAVVALVVRVGMDAAAAGTEPSALVIGGAVVFLVLWGVLASGLTIVAPNQARALTFFGSYVGTIREAGLRFTYPLALRTRISVKVRNFETARLKVNDQVGNPIEIAAVVVWQVRDTAEALFGVDRYEEFVTVQAETALRHVAGLHPYDADDAVVDAAGLAPTSLRASADIVSGQLREEIDNRVEPAGVEIIEARITHLAYAAEIAGAMLQRQQAAAVVAARSRIVDGAVGMAAAALARIEHDGVAELDASERARIVGNLLVVLASERGAQPVVTTGTESR